MLSVKMSYQLELLNKLIYRELTSVSAMNTINLILYICVCMRFLQHFSKKSKLTFLQIKISLFIN